MQGFHLCKNKWTSLLVLWLTTSKCIPTSVQLLPHISHTSTLFFVAELQIFCRVQIGLNFVRPSACRTLADCLSRLTALRLRVESSEIEMALIPLTWLSWHFLITLGAREPVLVHCTIADKTFWDLALPDIARQALILSQTCLNPPHTSRQVKIICRPTKNRSVCGDL